MSKLRGLALDASTGRLSIAVGAGESRSFAHLEPARDHTHRVYEHVQRLLVEQGIDFASLDFVAFGCGPGSFTGVRIAAAAAQAIAFAHDVPVCRVSSFALLAAEAARIDETGAYGICVDARLGRAYAALYAAGQPPRPLLPDMLANPVDFTMPGTAAFAAIGDGWEAFPRLAARHEARITRMYPRLLPSAEDLLAIGAEDFQQGRCVAAADALPEYLGQAPARSPEPVR